MEPLTAAVGALSAGVVVLGVLAAVGLVVMCVTWRIGRWIRTSNARDEVRPLPLDQSAFLRGGQTSAVLASLTYLYAAGTLAPVPYVPAEPASGRGTLASIAKIFTTKPKPPQGLIISGPLPREHSQLDAAVYAELTRSPGLRYGEVSRAPSVQLALDAIEDRLRTAGAFPSGLTKLVRVLGKLTAAGIVFCGLVLGFFSMYGQSSGGGLAAILLIGAGVVTYVFVGRMLQTPRLSARGDATVKNLRAQIPIRMMASAWPTVGATTAAFIVAVHGGAAIWDADPEFAAAAGIAVRTASSSSGSSCSGGSGSSCSGGSSCGGGCGG
jgi:uncharacterized protein (TIGR04222 family)